LIGLISCSDTAPVATNHRRIRAPEKPILQRVVVST